MRSKLLVKVGATSAAGALLLSSCLSSSGGSTGGSGFGSNKNTSKSITITVAFSGPQFASFKSGVAGYASQQGIKINWQSDPQFQQDIVNKVQSGNEPDIAMFPQPGILRQFASEGKLADLKKAGIDTGSLKDQLIAGAEDIGTVNGKVYGIPPSVNIKNLIFYPKKAWDKDGLTAPTTLADLLTFSAKLKSEGKTPWCIGISSPPATGWPATDWMEQLILSMYGTQTYNDWVQHKIKFSDSKIRGAFDYFEKIFGTSGWVYGGRSSISGTAFGTAGNPMFNPNNTSAKPGCYMFKQGNFITGSGFFPNSIVSDLDSNVGVFQFPGKTANDKPVEFGGDVAALFSGKNKYAVQILKYMLTPTFCASCPKTFAYVSPFKKYSLSNYPNKLAQQMATLLYTGTAGSFDGSDAMPGAVGSGTFWTQMTAWISGTASLSSALSKIDSSWPKS